MCWAAQAIFDISTSEGKESLVGTVFCTQEELDHHFPYHMTCLGNLAEEDMEEDTSDLEDLTDLFAQTCPHLPSPQPDDLDNEEESGDSSSENLTAFLLPQFNRHCVFNEVSDFFSNVI